MINFLLILIVLLDSRDCRGRDGMVVGLQL